MWHQENWLAGFPPDTKMTGAGIFLQNVPAYTKSQKIPAITRQQLAAFSRVKNEKEIMRIKLSYWIK